MPFIDTHAHIYIEEFDNDRADSLEKAVKEGVTKIFMPAIDSSTHIAMLKVENEYPGICYSMIGLHPCSVREDYELELKTVWGWLEKRPFLAIGEIGLDFYWDLSQTNAQYDAFHRQIEWALHFDLPIVIHSRNSIGECIQVVADHQKGKLKGVFHCFSGNLKEARQIIDLGFYLGIGGVVTFKNSDLDQVIEELNMDNILLETDSPWLAPVPFRGKKNESAYIKYIAQKMASIKKISVDKVGEVTTKNAIKLFGQLNSMDENPGRKAINEE